MTLKTTYELTDEIIKRRKNKLKDKISKYPRRNFIASDIHECDRYMVYSILDWDKKPTHDESTQAIFDAGNKEEESVKNRLGYELGIEFIQSQQPFELKNKDGEIICRGKIDGKILYNREAIPIEIKSMGENIFNTINKIEDFQKKPWHRKYVRQMMLYLAFTEQEAGLFIISDFRREKIIPIIFNQGEADWIISRLERLWECVKNKEYPDPIDYKPELCDKCPFAHICIYKVENKDPTIISNQKLEEKLERREELKDVIKEYKSLDEEIKSVFREIPEAFVGKEWLIKGKKQIRKSIDTKALPDNIKEKYAKETEAWITIIKKL